MLAALATLPSVSFAAAAESGVAATGSRQGSSSRSEASVRWPRVRSRRELPSWWGAPPLSTTCTSRPSWWNRLASCARTEETRTTRGRASVVYIQVAVRFVESHMTDATASDARGLLGVASGGSIIDLSSCCAVAIIQAWWRLSTSMAPRRTAQHGATCTSQLRRGARLRAICRSRDTDSRQLSEYEWRARASSRAPFRQYK